MTWNSKVIWSEGMFLRPQHFQQHDRYIENLVDSHCGALRPFGWGLTEFGIDDDLRALGKIAIATAKGVMPDGTPFDVPGDDDVPPPLDVPPDMTDAAIYLSLPVRRMAGVDVAQPDNDSALARYTATDGEVHDNSGVTSTASDVKLGRLRLSLTTVDDDAGNFSRIPLARVVEVRNDGMVVLDDQFIPTCLRCGAHVRLRGFLTEIQGLLRHRGESLAGRVSHAGSGGVSEFADYLLLQLVNRYEPLFSHLAETATLHPEEFYCVAVQLAGELATFTRTERRPNILPTYDHGDLQETFRPLIDELRRSLSMVLEQNAVQMPLEERRFGVRVATITDREMMVSADLVLAVHADLATEVLAQQFPRQVKIGAVENIAELVNLAILGVTVRQLPVAPRQIPYHAGYSYFELDKKSEHWSQILQSGGIAVHVGAEIPGIDMQLWAIRG